MKKFFVYLAVVLFGSFAAMAADEIIALPKFEVVGERPLPDMEHWRYARIPGYEILAQCSDEKTQHFAELLNRMEVTLKHAWAPAAKFGQHGDTTIILCSSQSTFDTFIPEKVKAKLGTNVIDRLLLHAGSQDTIVLWMGGLRNGEGYRTDLLRHYIKRCTEDSIVQPPAWLIEGLCQILSNAAPAWNNHGKTIISIGQLTHSGAHASAMPGGGGVADDGGAPPASIYQLYKPEPEIVDIVQDVVDRAPSATIDGEPTNGFSESAFKRYFLSHDIPSLGKIFSNDPSLDRTDWKEASALFVHFCIFRYGKRNHQALEKFLNLTDETPGTDSEILFKKSFGASFASMGASLRGYVDSADYQAKEYTIQTDELAVSPDMRDATNAEISRIKGDTYLLAGQTDSAGEELKTAYRRDNHENKTHDPQLLASLGLWQAKAGDATKAKLLLQAAAAAKYPRVEVYTTLARLQLDAAGSSPLTAQQTANCLMPLFTARAVCRPWPEVYDLIAQVWSRSAAKPSRENLAVLDEGVNYFPAGTDLTFSAAQLNAKFGYADAARALANHGLRTTRNDDEKARFAALLQSLGPAAPSASTPK